MQPEPIMRAPRGAILTCKGWGQEAAMRMLMNNLDPEVAENPAELVVYGGRGKAARNWECFHAIVAALKALENDETLLVQSGKPVGVFRTRHDAPRVLLANANLVPAWSTQEVFDELDQLGLTMFGQMTAGSWIYIGTQGILQGTYETLAKAADQHFGGTLRGKLIITAGLGGMGGAQPLAVTMNEGVALVIEVDEERIKRRLATRYLDTSSASLEEALAICREAQRKGLPRSVGLLANAADVHPELVRRGVVPDLVTDQTPAHDPLSYVPSGLSVSQAEELRKSDPGDYKRRSHASMAKQVAAMLELRKRGAIVFEYGNNLRQRAFDAGVAGAFDYPGFVPAYIRPLFCEGKGPFRWVALSGEPADIHRIDALALHEFAGDGHVVRWIKMAQEKVAFQGLPARICWLGYGERARLALAVNQLVRQGELKAPVVFGRDHLDTGSVASPRRETEAMRDGSDAIADWPLLNALLNAVSGATWVSIHSGGGVGVGYSIHAGQVTVADGTGAAAHRLARVLDADPGVGIVRHADAGYPEAVVAARRFGLKMPMLKG